MSGFAGLGVDTVILSPRTGRPARCIEEFAAPEVGRVADLS